MVHKGNRGVQRRGGWGGREGEWLEKLKGRKNMPGETQRKKEKDEEKERGGAIRSLKREILKTRQSETEKNQNTGRGEEWENQRERRGTRHTGGAGPQGRRRP